MILSGTYMALLERENQVLTSPLVLSNKDYEFVPHHSTISWNFKDTTIFSI